MNTTTNFEKETVEMNITEEAVVEQSVEQKVIDTADNQNVAVLAVAEEPNDMMAEFNPNISVSVLERCADDNDIPDDERAVEEKYTEDHLRIIESARAAGVFHGGKGTVLVPETNGVVYAGIWETKKEGMVIRVLFRREDGQFTKPIEFNYAIFTIAAQNNFNIIEKGLPYYRDIVQFHKKAIEDILSRIVLCVGVDYETTLKMLWKYHQALPVHELVEETASIENIYDAILYHIRTNPRAYHNATKYFRLETTDMDEISKQLEMSTKEICVKLKEYGLLYLTRSSVGYQTKVKYEGETRNCYCVIKEFAMRTIAEPTVIEDGTQAPHDRKMYQQLFGSKGPQCLEATGSKSSKEQKVKLHYKGATKVDW